jgi:fused signal recognition particle receptor
MLYAIDGTVTPILRGDGSSALIILIAAIVAAVAVIIVRRKGKPASPTRLEEQGATPSLPAAPELEASKDDVLTDEGGDIASGLAKTRSEGFVARLSQLFSGGTVSPEILDQVEEVLLTSDIGVRTADRLMTRLKEELSAEEMASPDAVWSSLKMEATRILTAAQAKTLVKEPQDGTPKITMVLGVNGTGKTTSIGKLADRLCLEDRRVTLVAADTFRAAAAEQLEVWGRRVNADVFRGKEGADPSSVVFDGLKQAVEAQADHVFVDTAGRLHTQTNLMEELRKVRRVMGKAVEGSPHEVLMVLDATTGQNAIQQARTFNEVTEVTGIVLTKLDGTAKGGIVIGIADELGIPIRYVGVGERVKDLRDFDAMEFVEALFAR